MIYYSDTVKYDTMKEIPYYDMNDIKIYEVRCDAII